MKSFIKLCIFSVIMMVGMASCCGPSSDNGSQNTSQNSAETKRVDFKNAAISDVEIVHKHAGDICIRFAAFTYNGHRYIETNEGKVITHAPDCPCLNTNSGDILNSSLFNSSPSTSSSLWDW